MFCSVPAALLLGSPLFSNGLSYVLYRTALCFLMGPLNYSVGCSLVFHWVPLAFLWVSFIILWVFACFFMDPPSFYCILLCVPMCSSLFSNGFPSLVDWVLLCFLSGSSLVLMAPLIFLLCTTLYSTGLSYVFYWVPLCFLMGSHHSSIRFPFVF